MYHESYTITFPKPTEKSTASHSQPHNIPPKKRIQKPREDNPDPVPPATGPREAAAPPAEPRLAAGPRLANGSTLRDPVVIPDVGDQSAGLEAEGLGP